MMSSALKEGGAVKLPALLRLGSEQGYLTSGSIALEIDHFSKVYWSIEFF